MSFTLSSRSPSAYHSERPTSAPRRSLSPHILGLRGRAGNKTRAGVPPSEGGVGGTERRGCRAARVGELCVRSFAILGLRRRRVGVEGG